MDNGDESGGRCGGCSDVCVLLVYTLRSGVPKQFVGKLPTTTTTMTLLCDPQHRPLAAFHLSTLPDAAAAEEE